jgi:WD40 repeat protein
VSEAFLTLRCPSCGVSSDRAPVSLAGRKVRCGACHSTFLAPAAPRSDLAPPPVTPGPLEPLDIDLPELEPSDAEHPAVEEPAVERPADQPPAVEAPTAEPPVDAGAAAPSGSAPAPTVPDAEDGALGTAPAPTVPEADLREQPRAAPAAGTEWRTGDLVLGLYEVLGVLGEGGMGRVYRVHHRGWDLDLAVKVPLPAVLDDAGGADLFEREAETWVNLGLHPHVITCHYVRRAEGLPLVFAEYADGGSLHDALRAGRLDSVEAILDVAIQFAWGLHHAHEQGLVHRDVKPANVMLTADGLAKVTDFGLARSRAVRLAAPGPAARAGHTMTVEGGGGATPAYVSPEQARGETLSRRSDLWSYALSVLEMFAGKRSWDFGLKAPEVLASYRREGLRAAGRPAMPGPVAELLELCFRERADERPHDLAEVAGTLREVWEASAGTSYPRREPRGGRGTADALNNRAASLVDLGRAAEAATLWRRALELEPHHVEATFNGMLAAWTEARIADSELLRHMEEACASHPSSARARQLQGRLHLALGQPGEAAAAFDKARALGSVEDLDQDLERTREPRPGPDQSMTRLVSTITALAAAPGGRVIVAGSPKELRVFDGVSGQTLRTIAVEEGSVRSLLVTPDGRFVLAALEGAPISLWELASGRHVRNFTRHTGFATSLTALPAGFVASGGSDRIVRLWDLATGRCLRELAGHEDAVSAVAAGDSVLASAGRDGTVRIWSIADGRCLATLRGNGGRVHALALSEPQSRLVSAGDDGVVRDWGLRSHALVRSYASHAQTVQALALAADGTRILSGSTDRTLRGFDVDGERLCLLARLEGAIQAITFGAEGYIWVAHGNRVSATRWDSLVPPPLALCRPASAEDEETRTAFFEERVGEARRSLAAGDFVTAFRLARDARSVPGHERARAALAVWDDLCARLPRRSLLSAWEESRLEGHAEAVLAIAIDAVRDSIATASLDGTVRARGLASRAPDLVLRGHDGAVTGVAFLPTLPQILSSGRDHTLRLWDATSGAALAVLEGHAETVAAIDVSRDGLRAASAGWDASVRVWDLKERTIAHVLEGHDANVASVRFSLDGQVIASAGWDGTARLWDADSGKSLAVLAGHDGNVTAVAMHPAGRLVATGCDDHNVRLFDPRAKRPPRVLAGHSGEVTGLAFTADGRFLLSSSRDRSVRVWDVRRGEMVRSLSHPAMVLGLALAPAGSLLATACADRTARLWHLDWEPEATAGEPVAAAATGSLASPAVAPAASIPAEALRLRPATTRVSTLREDLSRNASGRVQALRPRASIAARHIPWAWIGIAVALLLATAVSALLMRKPAPRLRLSPQATRSALDEVDLIDLAAFRHDCVADEYQSHLQQLQDGRPSARDVACIADRGSPGMVTEVLESAPLSGVDGLDTLRLRRNAASVLAGVSGEAVSALCARLGDEREGVRAVVAAALGVTPDPAASECLRRALLDGPPPARTAAVPGMRQQIVRGRVSVEDGWRLVRQLLASTDPQVRVAGLSLTTLFTASVAGPAARALLTSSDSDVASAARKTVSMIEALRRADKLLGDIEP